MGFSSARVNWRIKKMENNNNSQTSLETKVSEVTNQSQATLASINWNDKAKHTWNGYYTAVIIVRNAFEFQKAMKFAITLTVKQRIGIVADSLKSDSVSLGELGFTSAPPKGAGRCIGQFLNPIRDELEALAKSEAPTWDQVEEAFSNWVTRFPRLEVALENADKKVRTVQRSEAVVKAYEKLIAALTPIVEKMSDADKVRLLRDLNKATSSTLKELAKKNAKAVAEAEEEDADAEAEAETSEEAGA